MIALADAPASYFEVDRNEQGSWFWKLWRPLGLSDGRVMVAINGPYSSVRESESARDQFIAAVAEAAAGVPAGVKQPRPKLTRRKR